MWEPVSSSSAAHPCRRSARGSTGTTEGSSKTGTNEFVGFGNNEPAAAIYLGNERDPRELVAGTPPLRAIAATRVGAQTDVAVLGTCAQTVQPFVALQRL